MKGQVNGTPQPMRLADCLVEVTQGIGDQWEQFPVLGATRSGLAPAKEAVGKNPHRYKPVEPGTVFYNPMRILLGSIAMVDEGEPAGITSPDYVVLRTREGVLHHRFFYYWLRSIWGEQLILSLARGAVRERILFNRLADGEVPVPPWSVQLRVADALAAIPRLRRLSQERIEAARQLPGSFIREVFEGSECQRWTPRRLGEICNGNGQYGTSQRSHAEERGVPVLGMYHIHEGRIRWEKLSYLDLPSAEREKYQLLSGDILFNRTNSAEIVGKTAVFDGARDAVFASYLIRFRVSADHADPRFVTAFINSRPGRAFIEQRMARAIGQVNISASTMHEMQIPCPPLSVQRAIGDRLDKLRAQADVVIQNASDESALIDALPLAYLRSALHLEDQPNG
jgi:restriction endonuclease S subunit